MNPMQHVCVDMCHFCFSSYCLLLDLASRCQTHLLILFILLLPLPETYMLSTLTGESGVEKIPCFSR